ncbi:MAG: glycosyltransferase [Chthoniobacteraceae bacterium]
MAAHVAICIPSGEMVHADFMLSVLHVVQNGRVGGARVSMVNAKFSIVAEARNLCVRAALDAKAEWLLFLDSDMVFPPDTIKRLLAHRKAIVGATYPRKMLPLTLIGTRRDGAAFSPADKGMVEASRMPTGCLLIKAEVFEKLKPPFFRCGYDEEHGKVLSEDFWFSDRVRELGVALWCDMELSRQVEHIGSFRYSLRKA